MSVTKGKTPSDPHAEMSVKYYRTELNSIKALVFLFHGRGGGMQSVYEQLGQHLLGQDILLVVPQAYANSWYPFRFNEPISINQPWLDSAINWIHNEINTYTKKGLDPERIFFGGFSQGSCLAIEYPLRYPHRYGGIFCLSGGVIGPIGSRQPLNSKELNGTPIFMGCSDNDDWIPQDKFDESVQFLRTSGGQVESKIYSDLGHTVSDLEIEKVKKMIERVVRQ